MSISSSVRECHTLMINAVREAREAGDAAKAARYLATARAVRIQIAGDLEIDRRVARVEDLQDRNGRLSEAEARELMAIAGYGRVMFHDGYGWTWDSYEEGEEDNTLECPM